jgi:LacI family transcriptional regulator
VWFGAIIEGLRRGCDNYNKDLLIHRNFHGRSADDIYRDLFAGKVDGLILPASCEDIVVQRLIRAKVPAVALADPHKGLPTVFVDSVAGFCVLAKYLAGKGHTRILYRDEDLRLVPPGRDGQRRVDAFTSTAQDFGIEVIISNTGTGPIGRVEAELLLGNKASRPTAVVCFNDVMAHQTMRFCHQNGIRVPDDLAVTGFDGFESPYAIPYDLTTVIAPWSDCAAKAVEFAVDMAEGKEVPLETALPVTLKLGTTT